MGIFSFLSGLLPGSRSNPTSQSLPSDRVEVTAQFNHKLGPLDRGDRYEDPLNEALAQHGYGETDGGGTMQTKVGEIEFIDVHMFLTSPDVSIPFVIQFLENCGAPKGSKLSVYESGKDREIAFGKREGFAIYLDGVNLPDEVYQTADVDLVVSEIDKSLAGHGAIEAHWQGPTETALYIYGDSISTMKPLIAEFMASYPLCQGARIVDLTP